MRNYLHLLLCWIGTDGAKAMVVIAMAPGDGVIALALVVIMFFTTMHSWLKKKKKLISLKNVLDNAVKIINCIKF